MVIFLSLCPEENFVALSYSSSEDIQCSYHAFISFESDVCAKNLLKRNKNTVYICRSIEFNECESHTLDNLVIKESVEKWFVLKSQTLDYRLRYQIWAHCATL